MGWPGGCTERREERLCARSTREMTASLHVTHSPPSAMSPSSRPVRDVKVLVPRHNSQRLGPATIQQVEVIARKERKRVDVRQTASDPSSILAQAIVSGISPMHASEI